MGRMIPKKSHSIKAIWYFSVLNKGRSKINHMTNEIYFYDSEKDEKYHRQWKMDGYKQWSNCMENFAVCVFIYLDFPNPPSSSYNAINRFVQKFPLTWLIWRNHTYPLFLLKYGCSRLWPLKKSSKFKW